MLTWTLPQSPLLRRTAERAKVLVNQKHKLTLFHLLSSTLIKGWFLRPQASGFKNRTLNRLVCLLHVGCASCKAFSWAPFVHYACLHIVALRCKYLDESSPDVGIWMPEAGPGKRCSGHPSAQINTVNFERVNYFCLCGQNQQLCSVHCPAITHLNVNFIINLDRKNKMRMVLSFKCGL